MEIQINDKPKNINVNFGDVIVIGGSVNLKPYLVIQTNQEVKLQSFDGNTVWCTYDNLTELQKDVAEYKAIVYKSEYYKLALVKK